MRWRGELGAVFVVLVGVAACATTEFKSTWKDPTATPGQLQGKRVASFVLAKSEATRREGELVLAREVSAHGAQGVPGYKIMGTETGTDKEALRAKLTAANIDAAVVMRVLDERQEVNVSPGAPGPYGSFYGYWDYGWGNVYDPATVTTNTVVRVETLVYSVPEDKLLWSGVSETYDPTKVDKLVKEVADKASDEMAKQGLMVKEPQR